jgi:hypothetical protein
MNQDKIILSLFDYSGAWSEPYKSAGYTVLKRDLKTGNDIFTDTIPEAIAWSVDGLQIYGLLAAVPCTDFASSGARWWKDKDSAPSDYSSKSVKWDNRLEEAEALVLSTLFIIELLKPKFWVIENPIGRIQRIVPEIGPPRMYFDPCDFGELYTKKTALYGNFNTNLEYNNALPLFGSEMWSKYGGKSERTKEARSRTPGGFARAFYNANK